jgi:hypothetical protein
VEAMRREIEELKGLKGELQKRDRQIYKLKNQI